MTKRPPPPINPDAYFMRKIISLNFVRVAIIVSFFFFSIALISHTFIF